MVLNAGRAPMTPAELSGVIAPPETETGGKERRGVVGAGFVPWRNVAGGVVGGGGGHAGGGGGGAGGGGGGGGGGGAGRPPRLWLAGGHPSQTSTRKSQGIFPSGQGKWGEGEGERPYPAGRWRGSGGGRAPCS